MPLCPTCTHSIVAVGAPGADKVYVFNLEHTPDGADDREREEREKEEREKEEEHERDEHDHHRHKRQLRRSLQEEHDHDKEEKERREEEDKDKDKDDEGNSEWRYWEVLVISANQGYNDDRKGYAHLNFGCSVAMHNSSVPSIVIGASSDGLQSATGGVYVVSMPHYNHFFSEWSPGRRRRVQDTPSGRKLQEHDEHDREEHDREEHDREEQERREESLLRAVCLRRRLQLLDSGALGFWHSA